MRQHLTPKTGRGLIPAFAYGFAVLSCVAGLSLCLIKSPQAQSESYLALSVQAPDIQSATAAAWEAARLNPSSAKAWDRLAFMLHQKGDVGAAQRARFIASRLQNKGEQGDPIYALPAELKLSLLADVARDIQ
jgi:hypothetical protein